MKHIKLFEADKKEGGMLVFVYRTGNADTTARGLTSKKDQLVLVGEGVSGPFPPSEGEDYLVLVRKTLMNKEITFAVPKSVLDAGEHPMFGGNFVYTSDSRFSSINNGNPIKVHDRVE